MKAPPTHSIWSRGTLSSHLAEMVTRINSSATSESPKRHGKTRKAVNLIILRNTRNSRSLSSAISTSIGCATCSIVPEMVVYAMVSHFIACVKLPTVFIGKIFPKINVSTLLLMVLMIVVTSIFTLKGNILLTGDMSICNDGRHISRV